MIILQGPFACNCLILLNFLLFQLDGGSGETYLMNKSLMVLRG